MMRDEWTNIENTVNRTEAAVIEQATAIAQIKRQIALIIEAFERLDICKLQGLENHPQGETARERFREILQQLKASYAALLSKYVCCVGPMPIAQETDSMSIDTGA